MLLVGGETIFVSVAAHLKLELRLVSALWGGGALGGSDGGGGDTRNIITPNLNTWCLSTTHMTAERVYVTD